MHLVGTILFQLSVSDIVGIRRLGYSKIWRNAFPQKGCTGNAVSFRFSNKNEVLMRVNFVFAVRISRAMNSHPHMDLWKDFLPRLAGDDAARVL